MTYTLPETRGVTALFVLTPGGGRVMYAPHGVAFAKQCSSDRGGTAHASCLFACQRMRVCPTFRSAAVGITARALKRPQHSR